MSRPLRIEYPGAVYHVISRGNAHQDIFVNDEDRLKFFYWMNEIVDTHNVHYHAYCLMDNHYHLLVETPDGNLSTAMRDINGKYTQWLNSKHSKIGHLFQGRYKAFVIEKDTYLLEVARYIVLNPVKAGLVEHPSDWHWSSYKATVGTTHVPKWLTTDWLLNIFSEKKLIAQREYRRFVEQGIKEKNPYDDVKNGFILGSAPFVDWIWEKTCGSEEIKEYPRNERIVGRPSLVEIFQDVKTKEERNDAICFARIRCGYLASEIARHISLDPAVVGRISRGTYNSKSPKSDLTP